MRFHAFQGIYLFVAYLLIDWVVAPMLRVASHDAFNAPGHILRLAVFAASIWMIVKTSQEQMFSLPIIGDLAERSVAEQQS